ncbi:glycerophosphodiester phosphodiesterase [Salibacterium aidingense]|uniref:glycerophosphodiester phosphodiesterase n=1 Tax=Salibacterium aidingense TaxID=384933 RepID=UPI00047BB5EA|nr:glycerophosphodiester phosphodiesterase [Salibacterium aidingense]
MGVGNDFVIIAHRGSTNDLIRENTLAAFQRAARLGADMIETDIRVMKDNNLVCSHNPGWNGRLLREMSYEEFRTGAEQKEGWTPALLSDVLPLLEEGIGFNIEIKEKGIERQVLNSLPSTSNIVFSSFEEGVIGSIKALDKKVKTALIVGQSLFSSQPGKPFSYWRDYFPEKRLKAAGADVICPHFRMATPRFIQRMHRKEYKVYVWTVNRPERWKRLLKSGADAIFTDEIGMGRHFRR